MGEDAVKKAAAKSAAKPSEQAMEAVAAEEAAATADTPTTGEANVPNSELREQFRCIIVSGGRRQALDYCDTYDDALLAGLSALKDGEGDRFTINKVYMLA